MNRNQIAGLPGMRIKDQDIPPNKMVAECERIIRQASLSKVPPQLRNWEGVRNEKVNCVTALCRAGDTRSPYISRQDFGIGLDGVNNNNSNYTNRSNNSCMETGIIGRSTKCTEKSSTYSLVQDSISLTTDLTVTEGNTESDFSSDVFSSQNITFDVSWADNDEEENGKQNNLLEHLKTISSPLVCPCDVPVTIKSITKEIKKDTKKGEGQLARSDIETMDNNATPSSPTCSHPGNVEARANIDSSLIPPVLPKSFKEVVTEEQSTSDSSNQETYHSVSVEPEEKHVHFLEKKVVIPYIPEQDRGDCSYSSSFTSDPGVAVLGQSVYEEISQSSLLDALNLESTTTSNLVKSVQEKNTNQINLASCNLHSIATQTDERQCAETGTQVESPNTRCQNSQTDPVKYVYSEREIERTNFELFLNMSDSLVLKKVQYGQVDADETNEQAMMASFSIRQAQQSFTSTKQKAYYSKHPENNRQYSTTANKVARMESLCSNQEGIHHHNFPRVSESDDSCSVLPKLAKLKYKLCRQASKKPISKKIGTGVEKCDFQNKIRLGSSQKFAICEKIEKPISISNSPPKLIKQNHPIKECTKMINSIEGARQSSSPKPNNQDYKIYPKRLDKTSVFNSEIPDKNLRVSHQKVMKKTSPKLSKTIQRSSKTQSDTSQINVDHQTSKGQGSKCDNKQREGGASKDKAYFRVFLDTKDTSTILRTCKTREDSKKYQCQSELISKAYSFESIGPDGIRDKGLATKSIDKSPKVKSKDAYKSKPTVPCICHEENHNMIKNFETIECKKTDLSKKYLSSTSFLYKSIVVAQNQNHKDAQTESSNQKSVKSFEDKTNKDLASTYNDEETKKVKTLKTGVASKTKDSLENDKSKLNPVKRTGFYSSSSNDVKLDLCTKKSSVARGKSKSRSRSALPYHQSPCKKRTNNIHSTFKCASHIESLGSNQTRPRRSMSTVSKKTNQFSGFKMMSWTDLGYSRKLNSVGTPIKIMQQKQNDGTIVNMKNNCTKKVVSQPRDKSVCSTKVRSPSPLH